MFNYSDSHLYKAIIKQLTRMLARALNNAPAADELPLYAQVLTDDLMNCGYTDADAAKVAGAIDKYGRDAEVWPNTKRVQDALREMRDKERREESCFLGVAKGPAKTILKPSIPLRLTADSLVKREPPPPQHVLNDDQHEALLKEDSIEGELYRDRMGYPQLELQQLPPSVSFEDLHDKSICP